MSGVLPEKTRKEMHDKNEIHRRLVERLREHACDVFRMTKGLDESAFTSRPEADSWSLKELVAHIRRVQQVFASRIETMLSKDNPSLESYSAEKDPEMAAMLNADGRLLVEVFLKERHTLAERLEKLAPAEWHRTAGHPEFAHFDVHLQVEFLIHHEANHLYQMFVRRIPFGKLPH